MCHGSIVNHQLSYGKDTLGSRYHAINLSKYLGLIRDIADFRQMINQDEPLGGWRLPKV